MQIHFKDDLDWKEYRPIGFIFQSLGYLTKTATRKWLFSLTFLAEWTGLEPATPGVTGWGIKRASMRVCGLFAIPKTADFAQFLPGMRQSYSKVFTALTGAPAQTVRRRTTSTGVSSRGRDAGRTFSPSSCSEAGQTSGDRVEAPCCRE